MSEPNTKVTEYADELINVPRAHLRMELRQEEQGLILSLDGTTLIECYLTDNGMLAGGFLAVSLGVKVPPLGESVPIRVSTGVLFRAIGITELDYSIDESFIILQKLLDEAEAQRGGSSEAV